MIDSDSLVMLAVIRYSHGQEGGKRSLDDRAVVTILFQRGMTRIQESKCELRHRI